VSDEFTVPLCAIHHHNIHTTGKEREWWQERSIDPLKVANTLWQQSRERNSSRLRAEATTENASDDREAARANQTSNAIEVDATSVLGSPDDAVRSE
jgi:hypothetical protein